MLNIGANVSSGIGLLKTLKSGKKQPTPSSSSANQLSDYVQKFVPSGPETSKKVHQKFLHKGLC
jgi:hypothetical protein